MENLEATQLMDNATEEEPAVVGKGCEFAWSTRNGRRQPRLKRTGDVAFGIVLPVMAWGGETQFSTEDQGESLVSFAFSTDETRDSVEREIEKRRVQYLNANYKVLFFEENGLYWFSVWFPV